MVEDFRYGVRLMVRRPGFAAIAVATLALGIGTTTAIFAVTDRVLLRPVPYANPETLAVVWETPPNHPLPIMSVSPPNLHEWQRRTRSFAAMGGFQWRDVTLGGDEPERLRSARVTVGLLSALGVQPQLGRLFLPEEDRANARPVAIISDMMWRRRFQRDAGILGRTVLIDSVPTEIVGVMPPGFVCPPAVVLRGTPPTEPAELWLPHGTNLEGGQRGAHYLVVIGRLVAGATVESANREMNEIQTQIEREFPDYVGWRASVIPLVDQVTQASRRAVALLVAAVGFILLLACANVANLLIARGVGRRREYAVRSALGAGRARLAMHVIAESLALAVVGGAAGLLVALMLVRVIVTMGPATMPGLRDAQVDLRTALFTIAVSVIAALLAGALPALALIRARLSVWLVDRSGGATGLRAQQLLAIGQIGLAVTLLVTAALLVESFRQLRRIDPGFQPTRVTTAKLTLPLSRYPDAPSRIRAVDALVTGIKQLAGVEAAAMIDAVPLADNRQGTAFERLDGGTTADPTASPTANVAWITEGYFEAMAIPLLSGRPLTERDNAQSQPVVVINRRLARQVFGDENPIGRRVRVGNATQLQFEVIAVVGDERHVGVDTEATPSFFVPLRQVPNVRDLAVIVRSSSDALPGIRDVIRRVDPDMPLFQVRTLAQVIDNSIAAPRSMAWLVSAFAFSALMLAAIGVFGVLSHAVSQRTREIGVRMAVGASPQRVLGSILAEGLAQVALGLVVGAVLSLLTARLLTGLLFGVSAVSVAPYLVVVALLGTVSLIACLIPARRAMRIDPAVALRAD
jgi:putative ABC transport system permease protein